MHELTIAYNIVEIVSRTARNENAKRVDSINIEVGKISGIEIDALKFSLNIAIKDSLLEKAIINIKCITGKARCNNCLKVFVVSDLFTSCPYCSKYSAKIIKGKELRVSSIDIQ
ncbi:MAG: hydrogenase maturation nickel metallochaperone HypA [Bacteroidales bacterium]|jgi:hydrogenase nickel incorporation protein HypA/HybF|nr:hydrogenase maturation nickel metallochaperone HypA [Bacteroidales bacterium]